MTNQFKGGTKNLGLVLRFFKTSLNLQIQLSALAWFMLVATTFMAWVVSHTQDSVQKWWFYGSVHLVLVMSLMLAMFTKNLTQAANMQWIPGWRKAHLLGLVICLASLVAVIFFVGVVWTRLASEPWNTTLLPWLIFSASVAVCAAYIAPFIQADFRQIFILISCVVAVETMVVISQYSKTFSFIWPVWSVLRESPWLLALASSLAAWLLWRQPSPKLSSSYNLPSWVKITEVFSTAPKLPDRWLLGQRWPLLKVSFFGGNETTFWLVYAVQLPGIINSGIHVQILFYWFMLVLTGTMMGADIKLARQAGMLMLLPHGLSRHTLGKDMFIRQLNKHLTLLLLHTLVVIAALMLFDKPVRFLLEPSVLTLALGYAIFSAGWIAAFSRHKINKLMRVAILALPAVAIAGPLIVSIMGRSGPYLIAEQTQFGLALIFALTGWYLGRRYTGHWDLQDFNSLLKTPKLLA